MSAFAIRGYGIRCEDFKEHLVPEKVFAVLREEKGEDSASVSKEISEFEAAYRAIGRFNIGEIVEHFCYTYGHLGELFSLADTTGCLEIDDNPEHGRSYLYCAAMMPWEASNSPFQTESDVEQAIITAMQRLTDLTESEILDYIDDVYDGASC